MVTESKRDHLAEMNPSTIVLRIWSNRIVAIIGAVMLAGFVTGCSSFNREWRRAAKQPAPTNSISGRWEGHWISDANGHNGGLRCIVSDLETNRLEARFRASYMKILRFGYTVKLTATSTNGVWHFDGQEDLGTLAGGLYRYEGKATPSHFESTYHSEHDHGVFVMERPDMNNVE